MARQEQVRLGLLDRSGGRSLAWAVAILVVIFAAVFPFWNAVAGSRWGPFLMPGLTAASISPKSARVAGIPFPELLHRLVTMALDKEARS